MGPLKNIYLIFGSQYCLLRLYEHIDDKLLGLLRLIDDQRINSMRVYKAIKMFSGSLVLVNFVKYLRKIPLIIKK